jgi:hypothetical protein
MGAEISIFPTPRSYTVGRMLMQIAKAQCIALIGKSHGG